MQFKLDQLCFNKAGIAKHSSLVVPACRPALPDRHTAAHSVPVEGPFQWKAPKSCTRSMTHWSLGEILFERISFVLRYMMIMSLKISDGRWRGWRSSKDAQGLKVIQGRCRVQDEGRRLKVIQGRWRVQDEDRRLKVIQGRWREQDEGRRLKVTSKNGDVSKVGWRWEVCAEGGWCEQESNLVELILVPNVQQSLAVPAPRQT